jgi:hypothetical protein
MFIKLYSYKVKFSYVKLEGKYLWQLHICLEIITFTL